MPIQKIKPVINVQPDEDEMTPEEVDVEVVAEQPKKAVARKAPAPEAPKPTVTQLSPEAITITVSQTVCPVAYSPHKIEASVHFALPEGMTSDDITDETGIAAMNAVSMLVFSAHGLTMAVNDDGLIVVDSASLPREVKEEKKSSTQAPRKNFGGGAKAGSYGKKQRDDGETIWASTDEDWESLAAAMAEGQPEVDKLFYSNAKSWKRKSDGMVFAHTSKSIPGWFVEEWMAG